MPRLTLDSSVFELDELLELPYLDLETQGGRGKTGEATAACPLSKLSEQKELSSVPTPAPHLQDFYRLLVVHNALVFLHKCLRRVFNLIVRGALEHLCKARHERGVAVGAKMSVSEQGGAPQRGPVLDCTFKKGESTLELTRDSAALVRGAASSAQLRRLLRGPFRGNGPPARALGARDAGVRDRPSRPRWALGCRPSLHGAASTEWSGGEGQGGGVRVCCHGLFFFGLDRRPVVCLVPVQFSPAGY